MPERKKLSLTEVLAAFSKEANEVQAVTPDVPVAAPTAASTEVAVEKVASEPVDLPQNDAVGALKAIAKEAADSSRASMQKEAQLFGQIFATAVIDEFEKNAHVTSAEQNAYATVLEKIAAEEIDPELQKVAEEAYIMCLVKLAYDEGYASVSPEQMGASAMAPQMTAPVQPQMPIEPQSPFVPRAEPEVVPVVAAVTEEEDTDGGNIEAATEAVQDAAKAAKAVAQAAQAAVEAAAGTGGTDSDGDELEDEDESEDESAGGEDEEVPAEVVEQLPKVAHQAYEATREYLEKSASEREDMDKLAETLGKIEQEAYDLIMNQE